MDNHEHDSGGKSGKSTLDIAREILKQCLSGAQIVAKVYSAKTTPIPDLVGLENKAMGILSVCLLSITIILFGSALFVWHHFFPDFYAYLRIWHAYLENPIVVLRNPIMILFGSLLLPAASIQIYKKKMSLDIDKTEVRILLFLALSTAGVATAALVSSLFPVISHSVLSVGNNANFSSKVVVLAATMTWFVVAVVMTHLYATTFCNQLQISLGKPNEDFAKGKRILYLVGCLIVAYFICIQMILAETIYESAGAASSEKGKAILDAKKAPLIASINHCQAQENKIICAVTIAPKRYQDYTLYGNWVSDVEKSEGVTSKVSVLASVTWKPVQTGSNLIPTFHLEPEKFTELEITAPKQRVCDFAKTFAENQSTSGIFFKIAGRSDEYNLPRKFDQSFGLYSLASFYDELVSVCKN